MADVIYGRDHTEIDGSDEIVDYDTLGRQSTHMWHYTHDLDVTIDIHIYGTHLNDDDYSDAIEIESKTLSSDGDKSFHVMTDPWEKIRMVLQYGGDPTTGSLTIYHNAER